jgi:phage N-6-adenine-methyltransferase
MMTNALAKLDKATQMLAEAKNLDEVKNIMDIAEAARTYARAAKLGLEAQNHAAEIKLRSERKAGEMLSKLERSSGGQPTHTSAERVEKSEYKEVLDEQEIPNTTSYRWQCVAKIPEQVFEHHIAEIQETGQELTTSGLLRDVKNVHVSNNSGENEWYTPEIYILAARQVMGSIDIDPASSELANKTVKATKYYTEKTDGLFQDWIGKCWMNPPYSTDKIRKFIDKYAEQIEMGYVTEGIVLVNNATETNWFDTLISVSSAIAFPGSRIKFIDKNGQPTGSPLQGQAFLYAGKKPEKFLKIFNGFGWGAMLWKEE